MMLKTVISLVLWIMMSHSHAKYTFEAKPFDVNSMSNMPWGKGRPHSIRAVSKNLLKCLSEVTFTYRLAPNTSLFATGTLVVNNDLVDDLRDIFRELYQDKSFSMSLVAPIHHFGWDDKLSMESNNTSGFNYRYISGTKKLSNHAKGRAIDINPRVNPWVNKAKTRMSPRNGSILSWEPGSLLPNSPAHHLVQAFIVRGWSWGGHWKSFKDYQHFEKKISYPGNQYCARSWD